MRYVAGSFDEADMYDRLGAVAKEFDEEAGIAFNRLFYLSTAPSFFPVIARMLGEHGLNKREGAEVRIIVEKPFGTDLESALELNRRVLAVFDESQVFRIDHYLGKETVQNMLVLRFANGIFEPLWNRSYVDYVQITAAEDIGIGSRAGYYDKSGALRDLIQNHLLQLLMLLTMEPPVSFYADAVRDEKVKILHAIRAPTLDEVPKMAVRAQYGPGTSGGEKVPGYLDEEGVPDDSTTETYAAVRLKIDNWRWAGVPFYLRTGKRLARKITEIAVTLKPVPHLAFKQQGSLGVEPNQLMLTVQPNEGVSLSLVAKIPGARMAVRPVNMEFLYGTSFMSQSPEAYERLIMDTMRGDATLFARNDEVEAAWAICDPILEAWSKMAGPLPKYEAGSAGPKEADDLTEPGHKWRPLWRRLGEPPDGGRRRLERRGHLAEQDRGRAPAAARGAATPRTTRSRRRASATWSRSWTASGAARSRTGSSASAASTPRARSSARSRSATPSTPGPRCRATSSPCQARWPCARSASRSSWAPSTSTRLETIVDPLIVPDLVTIVWSPHGHDDAVDALVGLADVYLIDSVEAVDAAGAVKRARELLENGYVVDLAWLRSVPWRERIASTFDPPQWRPALREITAVTVRHHPESVVSATLFLCWLATRLGWELRPMVSRTAACVALPGARAQGQAARRAGRDDAGGRPRGRGARDGVRHEAVALPRLGRAHGDAQGARRQGVVVGGAGRLARRGGHPGRGDPPGAAARPDLRAGTDRRL